MLIHSCLIYHNILLNKDFSIKFSANVTLWLWEKVTWCLTYFDEFMLNLIEKHDKTFSSYNNIGDLFFVDISPYLVLGKQNPT